MSLTFETLIEDIRHSLPENYFINNKKDALIKAAFTAEELGEVVKAISHLENREVVKECADAIVGLLQIMDYYNDRGNDGIESAFQETIAGLISKKHGYK
jgi:NTP pyrophosphatase (non-canonical NTP hydrolase)